MYSSDWKAILDSVDAFATRNSGAVWYRGLTQSSYSLSSGLFRLHIGGLDEYLSLEDQMYRYYRALGYSLHGNESGWHLLYSMQHHGVRTRLLDWTESFPIALFFATDGWVSGNARVWMLNPLALNELSIGRREILSPGRLWPYPDKNHKDSKHGQLHSIAVYPIKNNHRIIAQHGVFTVQGNCLDPLESEFGDALLHGGLEYIDLSMDVREDALRFLKQCGITRFSLFPDADGLSRYLNELLIKPSWLA